jgi:hypothetical protein
MLFAKVSRLPPPSGCIITDYDSFSGINYFVVTKNNEKLKVAISPLSYTNSEFLVGTSLDKAIKIAADRDNENPFFIIEETFLKISGKVKVARTFRFGEKLLSELFIEKNDKQYVRIIFVPHRRNRRQGLSLVKKAVRISPLSLETKINGRRREWDGRNF